MAHPNSTGTEAPALGTLLTLHIFSSGCSFVSFVMNYNSKHGNSSICVGQVEVWVTLGPHLRLASEVGTILWERVLYLCDLT